MSPASPRSFFLSGLAATLMLGLSPAVAETREGWAAVNGTSLHYRIDGPTSGRPVVLVHEIGMTLQSWDDVAPGLARQRRIIRYDLRGSGASQLMRGPETLDVMSDDLGALLDKVAPGQSVDLVGSALGGTIALAFAAAHPERVHRLIVLSPVFNVADPSKPPIAMAAAGPSPGDILKRDGVRAYLTPDRIAAVYPVALQTDRPRYARFLGLQLAGDGGSRAIQVKIANERDFGAILPTVQTPTLLVATSLFVLRPPAMIQGFAARMPHGSAATLVTGHLAPLEDPKKVAELIEKDLGAP